MVSSVIVRVAFLAMESFAFVLMGMIAVFALVMITAVP